MSFRIQCQVMLPTVRKNGEAGNQGWVVWEAEIEWSGQVSRSWWRLGCGSVEMRSWLWRGLGRERSSQRWALSLC